MQITQEKSLSLRSLNFKVTVVTTNLVPGTSPAPARDWLLTFWQRPKATGYGGNKDAIR